MKNFKMGLPQCLPKSFRSIRLTVWEQIKIKDFQDGRLGIHHGDVANVKVTDRQTDDRWTMVNRPPHKLMWRKGCR